MVINNGELAEFRTDANEGISAGIVWAIIMIKIVQRYRAYLHLMTFVSRGGSVTDRAFQS